MRYLLQGVLQSFGQSSAGPAEHSTAGEGGSSLQGPAEHSTAGEGGVEATPNKLGAGAAAVGTGLNRKPAALRS